MPEDCSSCNLIANDGKCGDKDWKSQLKASQVHEPCGVTEESFQWSVQLFEFLLLELLRESSHSSLLKLNKGICKNFNEILQLEVFIWTLGLEARRHCSKVSGFSKLQKVLQLTIKFDFGFLPKKTSTLRKRKLLEEELRFEFELFPEIFAFGEESVPERTELHRHSVTVS